MDVIGHELTHTLQVRESGNLAIFLAKYLYGWASVGFHYRTNPYEAEAFANEDEVHKYLTDNPYLLDSVRSDGSISISQSPSKWEGITSLSNSVFDGQFALSDFGGGLYIEGVDLTGVLTWKSRF